MVHDVFGYWTLSKGSPEPGEDALQAAQRKVKEEFGIESLELGAELGRTEYLANDPEKGPVRRRVIYFLGETRDEELKLAPSGGLDGAAWFAPEDFEGLKTYPDIKPLLTKALKLIKP